MPQVSEIRSNLKRATTTYDEELAIPKPLLDEYNSRPVVDRKPTSEEQEGIDEKYEFNYAASASQRWQDQDRFMGTENERVRMVNIMHPYTFFHKLQKAGVDARTDADHFDVWMADDETGKPIKVKRERSYGRLWLGSNITNGRLGVSAWLVNKYSGERRRRQVTTLQYPCGPEWSLLYFDQFDVPLTEKYRGWRTALLQLILADIITEEEAIAAFGPVPLHPVSLYYRQQLQTHRARKAGLIR